MSSDMSADQLAAARSHVETALQGILTAADAITNAWGAVSQAGQKYQQKYAAMAGAGDRLQQAAAQMQHDIQQLSADEAMERGCDGMSDLDTALDLTGDQITAARDHLDSAYYYAAGVGRDTDQAVAEIDAALRLLQAARERLVSGAEVSR